MGTSAVADEGEAARRGVAGGAVTTGTVVAVVGATATAVLVAGGAGVTARAVAITSGVGCPVSATTGVAGRVAGCVGAGRVATVVTKGVPRVPGAATGAAAGAMVKEAAGVGGSMLIRVIAGAGTVTRPRTTASIVRSGVGWLKGVGVGWAPLFGAHAATRKTRSDAAIRRGASRDTLPLMTLDGSHDVGARLARSRRPGQRWERPADHCRGRGGIRIVIPTWSPSGLES